MSLDLQFKIKKNPNYLRYLRSHCYWYKILNRNDKAFKEFEYEVKKEYHLNATDKITNVINTFEMLEKILSTFK
jgi:hypothetical protein